MTRQSTRLAPQAMAVMVFGILYSFGLRANAAADAPGVREHDGFYFRLGLGGAYAWDAIYQGDYDLDGTLSGGGLAVELAFGGTPAPGLVIAGAILNHVVPTVSGGALEFTGTPIDDELELELGGITVYGVLVDWYPEPREGLHVEGALGIGLIAVNGGEFTPSGEGVASHAPVGPGLAAGVGYEFWGSQQWSFGGLLRLSYMHVSGEDEDGLVWEHSVFAPALLVTTTYH